MEKQRKHYTPEEKVAILRRHLLEQVAISELCDKHGLQPTVFYRWEKEFFENGAAAFQLVLAELARRQSPALPGIGSTIRQTLLGLFADAVFVATLLRALQSVWR